MKRDRLRLLIAALIGLLWPVCIPASLALPLLIARARTRAGAFLIPFLYVLAGSRGLPHGTAVFFGAGASIWLGAALWLAAATLAALPFLVFYQKNAGAWKAAGIGVALVLWALSPVGFVHPITGLGDVLPGSGLLGILIIFAAWVAYAVYLPRIPVFFIIPAILAVQPAFVPADKLPEDLTGVDTHYGKLASGNTIFFDQYMRLIDVRDRALHAKPLTLTAMPETVIGQLTQPAYNLIAPGANILEQNGSLMLVGAEIQHGNQYLNVLLPLGADLPPLVQHTPVPISMWVPFSDKGAVAAPFAAPSKIVWHGKTIEAAICYEQLLTVPMLWITHDKPDILIAASNLWWAKDTSIPGLEHAAMQSWARLMGTKLIESRNL